MRRLGIHWSMLRRRVPILIEQFVKIKVLVCDLSPIQRGI
jgi:hypothetical protein